jgi:hypothetical protein
MPATAEGPLARAAKKKLLLQMYRLTHWIELIRLFGYQTLPMDQARQAIKPLAEKFGKEPVAASRSSLDWVSFFEPLASCLTLPLAPSSLPGCLSSPGFCIAVAFVRDFIVFTALG